MSNCWIRKEAFQNCVYFTTIRTCDSASWNSVVLVWNWISWMTQMALCFELVTYHHSNFLKQIFKRWTVWINVQNGVPHQTCGSFHFTPHFVQSHFTVCCVWIINIEVLRLAIGVQRVCIVQNAAISLHHPQFWVAYSTSTYSISTSQVKPTIRTISAITKDPLFKEMRYHWL